MAAPTRRRLVAYGAALAFLAAGVTAYVLTRPSGPRWAGPALSAERANVPEYVLVPAAPRGPSGPADPALVAARRLGGTPDVEVVSDASPVVVKAERPVAPGTAPDDATALAAARTVLTDFGLVPDQWTHFFVPSVGPQGARMLRYVPRTDVAAFPVRGFEVPVVVVSVDAEGVRQLSVPLVTFEARQVRILSEREAFALVTEDGRYTRVRRVLVFRGDGLLRPHWEFRTSDGRLRPVPAVLTP